MLKPLTICLTVAALLLSLLLPAQAGPSTGCASASALADICPAPVPASPARSAVEKPCLIGILPAGTMLAAPAHAQQRLSPTGRAADTPGRVVPPDRRPPRA